MADELKRVCPSLDKNKLLSLVLDDAFKERELMDRMRHTTGCLREVLPGSYRKALAVLRKAAPLIKGCEALCLPDYVEQFGLEDWDLSKDHAGLVLDIGERWIGKSKKTDRVVKHACRTLLKAGDSRAMMLFGFGDPRRIAVSEFEIGKEKLPIGGRTSFRFVLDVKSKKACKVRLEYAVHFVKASGKTSPKVFKISEKTCRPGEHKISGNHAFADLSTRKHYPGDHLFRIIVNGKEKAVANLLITD